MEKNKNEIFKLISRIKLLENNWYQVFSDKIINNTTGVEYDFFTIDFLNDSVATVIKNENNELLFISSYRYPNNNLSLEIPAGSLEKNESIMEAGYRECLEETGYRILMENNIFTFYPNNGVSTQTFHVIYGKVSNSSKQEIFDKTEVSKIIWLSEKDVIKKILDNTITDGFTLVALFLYFLNKKEGKCYD